MTAKDTSQKSDVYTSHKGIKAWIELALRRFKEIFHILGIIPLYVISSLALGLCAVPGITLYHFMTDLTANSSTFTRYLATGFSLAFGYYLYGFSLIVLVPILNVCAGGRLKAWRGPYYSFETMRWYIHNGLTYLVRYTFLELATPTPFSLLFYQLMGMKIGKGVMINTTHISDPSLITIGDLTTIGGSVTIVAHYGQGGFLVIAPVVIGRKCTIGLKATIMGGVHIGDGAKILPHSVVLPKTKIPAGETWAGVPAQKFHVGRELFDVKIE